jgi:hypothetical protein
MHYFATDGNYGDATDILIVHTGDWAEEDWNKILDASDQDRSAVAQSICDMKQNNIRLLGL